MKKYKLGIIGCGFMGSSIIDGILSSNTLDKTKIIISNRTQEKLEKYRKLGINITLDNKEVAKNSEYVLFAIKPQNLNDVLIEIKDIEIEKIISILAGVKKQKFKDIYKNVKVARCMPNTPCSLGCGAIGVDLSDFTNDIDKEFIKNILSVLGLVVNVKEEQINAIIGVSGSAPAYFYLFLKGIIEEGIKQGLSKDDATNLVAQTMIGSGKMVLNNKDKSIDELIKAVCSKGGTTIEAVNIFNNNNLNDITKQAIDACINRAKELENQ